MIAFGEQKHGSVVSCLPVPFSPEYPGERFLFLQKQTRDLLWS